MGFGAEVGIKEGKSFLANVKPEDLIKYGMIPEFVGRFSMVTHVNNLSELQLVSVLSEPKKSLIKQYQYLFGLDDIELSLTKGAKLAVAKKARALGTNARGLKSILDESLLPYQFDAHEMRNKGVVKIEITEECIDKGADPVLIFKNKTDEKHSKQNSK